MRKTIAIAALTASNFLYAGTLSVIGPISGSTPNSSSSSNLYQGDHIHQRIDLGVLSGLATVHAEFNLQNVANPENNYFGLMAAFSENLNQPWLQVQEIWEWAGCHQCEWHYMGTGHPVWSVANAISPTPVSNGPYLPGATNYGYYSAAEKKYIFDFSIDFSAPGTTYLFLGAYNLINTNTSFNMDISGAEITDSQISVSAVPLPGSVWLLGSALMAVMARRRKL